MIILQQKKISTPTTCHYLSGEVWRFKYFFATGLNEKELGGLLSNGWRKFGYYFFKPDCPACMKCQPLRVCVNEFTPSKSQKRIIKKNGSLEVRYSPLRYTERIYDIYVDHSLNRFGKTDCEPGDFLSSFYSESCPTFQSEYYLDENLVGVGYVDRTHDALSSIYFIFDTQYSNYGLGTYSVLKEIDYAASLGLDYYYLGYYIDQCDSMAYKNKFLPYEVYDWGRREWVSGGEVASNK